MIVIQVKRIFMKSQEHGYLIIKGARENNLKNISVKIPKKKITVLTGVSGSGKSSLVFDTIAAESQRQLNETFSSFVRHRLPHFGQPDADAMENLSPAIVVDQKRIRGNARSTVGTITDIYALLRLLFSRIGKPFAGESTVFSFNHPEGMCPECGGLGTVMTISIEKLFDKNRSLNEGAIRFPNFDVGTALWKRYTLSGYFDNDKKLKNYTKKEWELLLYQEEVKPENPQKGWWTTAKYEGVIPRFRKRFLVKEEEELNQTYNTALKQVVVRDTCPLCHGGRLNRKALRARINGQNIADCSAMEVTDLIPVIKAITDPVVKPVTVAIVSRLQDLSDIGLGYLSLNRETSTLSGGESQRVKMVKHLGSSLNDMTYIFDEPSTGLHPRDVYQLTNLMKNLRDKGNTVLVVEHDPDVISVADHLIDMGPGAGKNGGEVVFEGTFKGLVSSGTLTGKFLKQQPQLKAKPRTVEKHLQISNARLNNLKNITIAIPIGVLTVVTGVAGSGKSSLINGVLSKRYPETVCIDQSALSASKRSNTATYTGISDSIRAFFARENKVSAALFSFNSEGACPACKGLGVTYTDLAFMDTIATTCEVCGGSRFTEKVLGYTLRGKHIDDVLKLSVAEALDFFEENEVLTVLNRLSKVGLGYLSLGQPLNTLSGGERQRIKLATELERSGQIYVLDEPTTGLHLSDVNNLIVLLNQLVEQGSTVIVIEHNLDVISRADWIIDMGPGAGKEGGTVVFQGHAADIVHKPDTPTGIFLKKYLAHHSVLSDKS